MSFRSLRQRSIFRPRYLVRLGLLGAAAALLLGCRRQHVAVPDVVELGYPTCSAGPSPEPAPPVPVAEQRLQSGDEDTRGPISEWYKIEKRDCYYAVTVRQEWPKQIADVEALYDENWLPVRVWRRWTQPGSRRPDGNADTKRFEFRTPEITAKHRNESGAIDFEILRGRNPQPARALIGPGRGLLTAWILRANLREGGKLRERALDFRGIETLRDVTLARYPDRYDPTLQRRVRVYSIYGRETVFTDDNNVVIGDLAGLVPATLAVQHPPVPLPAFEPPDPVKTP